MARRYTVQFESATAPEIISEGVGSLSPDQVCPALLWRIDLDSLGR